MHVAAPAEQAAIDAPVQHIRAAKAAPPPTGHGPGADTAALKAPVDAAVAALVGVAVPAAGQ